MVKIIRKVAVEFSREVEIIGGGGVKYFGEQMELFPWCRVFFMGIAIFPGGLFLWLALFFDEDISRQHLKLSFSHVKILPKIHSPKRTINCNLK